MRVTGGMARIDVVAAVLRRRDRALAARRPRGKARAGLWEFPGGKVEPGETHAQALRRELLEELGLEVQVGDHLATVEHDYSDLHLRLHAYLCSSEGEPQLREHAELRWLAAGELLSVPWSEADRRLAESLVAVGPSDALVYSWAVADPPKDEDAGTPPAVSRQTSPGDSVAGSASGVPTSPPWEVQGGQAGGTIRMDARDIIAACQQQRQRGSLLCIAGTNADLGLHLVIEDKVLIGREPPHGLQLHDSGVSRSHAAVECRGNTYLLRDLGSTNGTLVNGVRIAGERMLHEGDKIFLSQTVLKFTLVDETEAVYLRQVDQLVGTDDLTGLLSKHRFDAILKETIRTAQAAQLPLAAMMMDMDGLKAVNDRHGHHAGAETIRQVGGLIGRVLAGRGEACRFGGDEFCAFVTGADPVEAMSFAERIRRSVEEMRVNWQGSQLIVSISIGLAALTSEVTEAAALMGLADKALYRAKAGGKNRVST